MNPVFQSRSDAREAKWFSRRHETAEAHNAAVTHYKATRGKKACKARAADRDVRRAQVLAEIDTRLGLNPA